MLHQQQTVLSTKVAGVEEIIPPACLIPDQSLEQIKEKIESLKEDPQYFHTLMEPVFTLAKEELTVPKMTEKTMQVYQTL